MSDEVGSSMGDVQCQLLVKNLQGLVSLNLGTNLDSGDDNNLTGLAV